MEQEYVYEDEGLTLKKVGEFFKKGWLYMVISVVVAVLLVTIIAVPFRFFFKAERSGTVSIEFTYKGIDEGKAPNGTMFNSYNIISSNVLATAVDKAELGDVITDISKLRSSFSVEGVYSETYYDLVKRSAEGDTTATEKLRAWEEYPSKYNIVLSEPKKLGLSDSQTVQLLNKVVETYYEDFEKTYFVGNVFSVDKYTIASDESREFYDVHDEYVTSFTAIKSTLVDLQEQNPDFVSMGDETSTTFNILINELEQLSVVYENFNTFLVTNNIWRDKAVSKVTLQKQKASVTSKKENLQTYITNLKSQIDAVKAPNVTITNGDSTTGTTLPISTDEYYKLIGELNADLLSSNKLMETYENQLADIELRLVSFDETETSAADIARAQNRINDLETQTKALVAKINATISDYYKTEYVSSSVRTVKPAIVSTKSIEFSLLVIYIATIAAGLLIGMIIAGVKKSQANKKAIDQEAKLVSATSGSIAQTQEMKIASEQWAANTQNTNENKEV